MKATEELYWKYQRLRARWRLWKTLPEDLNRRVEVESVLINVAAGKRPPPDPDECMKLALKLGKAGVQDWRGHGGDRDR